MLKNKLNLKRKLSLNKNRGFALQELLFAIIIVSVLLTIGFGVYKVVDGNKNELAINTQLTTIISSVNSYKVSGGDNDLETVDNLISANLLDKQNKKNVYKGNIEVKMKNGIFYIAEPNLPKDICERLVNKNKSFTVKISNVDELNNLSSDSGIGNGGDSDSSVLCSKVVNKLYFHYQ